MKTVTFRSSDGEVFEVEERVAGVSKLIKRMLETGCAASVIPIPCVSSKILGKVLEYCKEQVSNGVIDGEIKAKDFEGTLLEYWNEQVSKQVGGEAKAEKEIEEWGKQFMDVDTNTLHDLLIASNFLDIPGLLNLAVDKVASMIRGKYPQEIRDMFNIVNDFTPEEEREIRGANPWAFEGEPGYDADGGRTQRLQR